MSAKAQRNLIKGARPNAEPVKRRKASNPNAANGIPSQDHTDRDKIVARLKTRRNP